jgi:imidazolonepropionase-like amidohydrolase
MAHVNGADAVRVAVAAGTDSVEHGFYLDEQAMSELASSDTVWVPTVAPVANLIGCGRFPDETLKKIVESQVLNIKRVSELGGIVAPGSDAGAYAVPHVSGTQDEYAYLKTALSDAAIAEGEQMIRIKFKRQ